MVTLREFPSAIEDLIPTLPFDLSLKWEERGRERERERGGGGGLRVSESMRMVQRGRNVVDKQ